MKTNRLMAAAALTLASFAVAACGADATNTADRMGEPGEPKPAPKPVDPPPMPVDPSPGPTYTGMPTDDAPHAE